MSVTLTKTVTNLNLLLDKAIKQMPVTQRARKRMYQQKLLRPQNRAEVIDILAACLVEDSELCDRDQKDVLNDVHFHGNAPIAIHPDDLPKFHAFIVEALPSVFVNTFERPNFDDGLSPKF